jgi:ABC-2 type transport system permease protein
MTATTVPTISVPGRAGEGLQPPRGFLHDTWVIARRGVLHLKRQPEALSDATVQPIMFVLLFGFVFGGAIDVPGGNYREFLMGGIFAQTIVFTAFGVAMSIANDFKNQAVDRFRSLPIARGAVLSGHAVANLLKTVLPIVIMSVCGLLVGWRINGGLMDALYGYLLMLLFAFAMIWVGVLLGSVVGTPEGVTGIGFVVLFPLTFVASTFVPSDTMPPVLQTVAEWNPVTTLSEAIRVLFDNPRTPVQPGDPWSIQHPVAYTVIWAIGIVLVCAPLAIRAYDRSIAR